MMKRKLMWVLAFVPLLMTAMFYRSLPDNVPLHFDLYGNTDNFASKSNLWVLAVLPLMLTVLAEIVGVVRRRNTSEGREHAFMQLNQKALIVTVLLINVFSIVLTGVMLYLGFKSSQTMDADFPTSTLLTVLIGVLLVGLGNMLPKTRRNSMIGFRVSWTLESDIVWTKTHRFGGIVMLASGLLTILSAFILPDFWKLWAFVLFALVGCTIVLIYSRKVYKEEKENE